MLAKDEQMWKRQEHTFAQQQQWMAAWGLAKRTEGLAKRGVRGWPKKRGVGQEK